MAAPSTRRCDVPAIDPQLPLPDEISAIMVSDSQLSHWDLVHSQCVITSEIELHDYMGNGTEADPYIVEWLPDDPRNPFNWSASYKWMIVIVMGLAVGSVSLCSSMYSGAEKGLIDEFNTNEEIATLGLSVFVLGFALGKCLSERSLRL